MKRIMELFWTGDKISEDDFAKIIHEDMTVGEGSQERPPVKQDTKEDGKWLKMQGIQLTKV